MDPRVQFEGGWLTFEHDLEKRLGLWTSHGMRPDQFEKVLAEIAEDPEASGVNRETVRADIILRGSVRFG